MKTNNSWMIIVALALFVSCSSSPKTESQENEAVESYENTLEQDDSDFEEEAMEEEHDENKVDTTYEEEEYEDVIEDEDLE